MKTIILQNNDVRVEIKADIFATNQEMQVAGFDVKFTAMEIVGDTEEAIELGINVRETEHRWRAIVDLATSLSLTLSVMDINEKVDQKIVIATGLSLSPATPSVARPGSQQFTPTFTPATATNKQLFWSITPGSGLSINQSGLVTIGAGTPAGNYTVKAESLANGSLSDTSVLTVTV